MKDYFQEEQIFTGSVYQPIRPIDRAVTTFIRELHIFMDSPIRIEESPMDKSIVIYVVNYDYKFKIFEEVFKRKISSEDNIIDFVKEICNDIEEHEKNKILTIY